MGGASSHHGAMNSTSQRGADTHNSHMGTQATADQDTDEKYLWDARCGVLYDAWVQLRYHRRRQRFFDLADKVTRSVTIVLGASLFGQFLVPWIALGITALGLLALIFGYGDRKQLHGVLAEMASNLIADVEAKPFRDVQQADVGAWRAAYARLCAKAPPALKTLTLLCAYEQSVVDGHTDHVPLPERWRLVLADFKS